MAKGDPFRPVEFLKRHKAAGKWFEKGAVESFFDRTAEALVSRGFAKFADLEEVPSKVKKARKPKLENKAHASVPETTESKATGELTKKHVDGMDKAELITWLNDNVEGHEYDGRFAEKTLRKAVKSELKKRG